ncbi:sensor histidine kinase [Daejeonella oryzae]|uniref:sensor histidine kinase n=1 Tax=Daejeonella oryzae TaxID=1122943 RepID=UPI00041E3966|nr:HAMP domain-containing sensor histidine kinase [Daejeonella oryzae]
MKLLTKLTLFITTSKLVIVLLFVLSLPYLVEQIASEFTNNYLRQQQLKVKEVISKNGIDFYLEGSNSYGSYTLLKEEYIALEAIDKDFSIDTIETTQRIIEADTLHYRVLMHTFSINNNQYLLEIGKSTSTISQYNKPLQRIASYVLIGLIVISLIADLIFTRFLLQPLGMIIKSKLINRKFPFRDNNPPVKTSTSDFKFLDNSLILLMEQIHDAFEKEREFTANASHELMTPISILQNKIENLMDDSAVDEELMQRLVDMQKTLNRLKKIVRSLLLISRIENEQFSRSETWNVQELFISIMEEINHRMEERKISIQLDISAHTEWKNLNRDLIFQLIYNLINNAIKYNKDKGSIRVSEVKTTGKPYELIIEDSGIGIADDDLPLIFNRFRKVKSGESEGYGLGLSIVKSIADYHDISISVYSELGKKSRFTLLFPEEIAGN